MALVRFATPLGAYPTLARRQAAGASPANSQFRVRKLANIANVAILHGVNNEQRKVSLPLRRITHGYNSRSVPPRTPGGSKVHAGHLHGESGETTSSRRLILYSKQGCCLCDGVKEKLEGIEGAAGIHLEVRDIATNLEWWNAYQYEIPVLTRLGDDGIEVPLPRLSPRLSAEQVQKKVRALMTVAS